MRGRVQGAAAMNSPHDGELGVIKGDEHNATKLRDLGRGVGNHSRWSGGAHTGEVTAYLSLTVDKSSFEMKERGLLEEGIMCIAPTLRTVGQRARHGVSCSRVTSSRR